MAQERVALPDPGDIAGRYEVVQKLGAGAFGTVYKAKDRLLGRMVAIKTIRLDGLAASGSGLDELLARFKREAQVSAQLKHPNIVTIYDIGDFEGLSYLAMEFIDGPGLEKIIASGRLPVERAAAIGAQIADALDYAHAHHVVHRDIKPANVMLESGDRVKVTDFGIAKAIDSGEHLTITGSLLGTPSYMSPEQARGGAIDGRSDLFSLGCILYEMVTGKKAFRGDSITALIFKIITEEPQPISEIDPSIPESITSVIARALSKAPETRFQSGHELATALLALTSPGALPTVRQVEVPTVAAPAAVAPATVVRPALARPTEPTRVAAQAARAEPQTPPVAPRRAGPVSAPVPAKRSSLAVVAVVVVLLLGFLLALGGGAWYFLSHRSALVTTTTDLAVTPTPSTTAGTGTTEATPLATPGPELASASPTPATGSASGDTSTPRSRVATALPTGPVRVASATTPEPAQPATEDYSFLEADTERSSDGRELGRDVASQYSSGGGRDSGYGTQRHLRQRPRGPVPRFPAERTALRVTHGLMRAEDALHERTGHYGSLYDLRSVRPALRAAPSQRSFQFTGYRFEVAASADAYQIMAVSLHGDLRSFIADSELDTVRVAD